MHITRRGSLLAAFAANSMLLLSACTTAPTVTPAQVATDAQGIVTALQTYLPLIAVADPNLMTPDMLATIKGDLAQAASLTSQISASTTALTGATTLQQADVYINDALAVLSAVTTAIPGSPLAPYAPIIQAVVALAPVVEAFVNTTLGTVNQTATASLRAKAVAPRMTPADARGILRIATVG